jgi:hypothetical protein
VLGDGVMKPDTQHLKPNTLPDTDGLARSIVRRQLAEGVDADQHRRDVHGDVADQRGERAAAQQVEETLADDRQHIGAAELRVAPTDPLLLSDKPAARRYCVTRPLRRRRRQPFNAPLRMPRMK